MNEKNKPWKCPNGHVLGLAILTRHNGVDVRNLLLYTRAIDYQDDQPEEVAAGAIVVGSVTGWPCSVCGELRDWYPGEMALQMILERRRR